MKKILSIVLSLTVVFALTGCGQAKIDYGTSELYTQDERETAIQVIKEEFNSWESCKLYSISYTSDERCQSELDDCNALAPEGTVYDECIVFDSRFRSPIFGNPTLAANSVYCWSWYLVRTENGDWELLTWGAA